MCLDPRSLNVAIKREHFQIPTFDCIATRLTGAQIFSKLDANHGYWQVQLDEESQLLTTFNTQFGRYCFLRIPFSIKKCSRSDSVNSLEIYLVLRDIDDIVWGRNMEEHDKRLQAVLKRCEHIHLTLNKEKCKFAATEVTYIGHKLVSMQTQKKSRQLWRCRLHQTRILGTNYLAKFIPDMSTKTLPIRDLLKRDITFEWGSSQDKAFQEIKQTLSVAPVLAFYDVTKPVAMHPNQDWEQHYCRRISPLRTLPEHYQMLKHGIRKLKKSCWQWCLHSKSFTSIHMAKKHMWNLTTSRWR